MNQFNPMIGHYLDFDANNMSPGTSAITRSPKVRAMPPGGCLRFWYTMYNTVGTLKLFMDKHGE